LRLVLLSFDGPLHARGVNQSIRLASHAASLSPNYSDGVYVTHLLQDARPIVRSYTNRAVIRRTPEGWRLTETLNGFSHKIWPIRVFYVPDDPPHFDSNQNDDARSSALEPLAIYQTFINQMTQANVAGDFDAYCAMCEYPHSVHAENHDVDIETPEDVRPSFDAVAILLDEHKIDDLVRIADHAEFVSSNEICGYHTVRFISADGNALAPMKTRIILRRTGTRWFVRSITKALSNEEYPYRHPIPAQELVTQLEIQKRTKTWPTLQ